MLHEKTVITVNGVEAYATAYILDETANIKNRPLVIICPGGGYEFVSDREAEPVAMQFNAAGHHAVVLRYSVGIVEFPTALLQLAKLMKMVREKTDEWNIIENKIFINGFSAGGHLAASLGVFWNKGWIEKEIGGHKEDYRPDGLILAYPVITATEFAHRGSMDSLFKGNESKALKLTLENQVDKDTPPAFIWHTYEDETVPVENTLLFTLALRRNNVPFESHIYQYGSHGLSLGTGQSGVPEAYSNIQGWLNLAFEWMKYR
ncbi:MAG: alpha/beta hydrolase [Oscillospiraceae bacterium]|nr:alpha/beta hydrolase [Oscillospiraceae bacterium]